MAQRQVVNSQAATVEYFRAIPWTAELMSHPLYQISGADSRLPKTDYEDSFTAVTMASPTTIPHLLPLRLRDLPKVNPRVLGHSHNSTKPFDPFAAPKPENATLIWLFTPLEEGMTGWPGLLHGGAIATMLDQCLSSLVMKQSRQLGRDTGVKHNAFVTSQLDITYKRPVRIPDTFMTRAWVVAYEENSQKRGKIWLRGDLVDSERRVYAEAKGLWIETRPQKL